MQIGHGVITDCVCLGVLDEGGGSYHRRILQVLPVQNAAAADKHSRVGPEIHLQLSEFVQDILGMMLTGFQDGLLYFLRKNGFLAAEYSTNMLILDTHVVQGANPEDDVVVHGDHTHFQAPAELKIGLSVSEEQNIGGIAADIHKEYTQILIQLALDTRDGSKCLRIDKDITHQNGEGLVIVDEVDGLRALEILGELVLQDILTHL